MPTCSEIPTKRPLISVDSEPMVSSLSAKYTGSLKFKEVNRRCHTSKDFKGYRLMSVVESSIVEYKCIVMPVAIYKLGVKWSMIAFTILLIVCKNFQLLMR